MKNCMDDASAVQIKIKIKTISIFHTEKNAAVDPPFSAPYFIFVWLASSSTLLIDTSIFTAVRKAARFAV